MSDLVTLGALSVSHLPHLEVFRLVGWLRAQDIKPGLSEGEGGGCRLRYV